MESAKFPYCKLSQNLNVFHFMKLPVCTYTYFCAHFLLGIMERIFLDSLGIVVPLFNLSIFDSLLLDRVSTIFTIYEESRIVVSTDLISVTSFLGPLLLHTFYSLSTE